MLNEILKILPLPIARELSNIGSRDGITEIRLRCSKRGVVISSNVEVLMGYVVTMKDLLDILVNISKNSILLGILLIYCINIVYFSSFLFCLKYIIHILF